MRRRRGGEERKDSAFPHPFHLMTDAFLAPDRPTWARKPFWESVVKEYCLLGSEKLSGSKAALVSWARGFSCLKVPRAPESPGGVTRMFCSFKPAFLLLMCTAQMGGFTPSVYPLPDILSGAVESLRGMAPVCGIFQLSVSFVSRRNCFPQLEILLYSFMF